MLTGLGALPAVAQTRVTLSGTVQDAKTAAGLAGATVRIVELPGVGTGADASGAFSLAVPAGTYTVEASRARLQRPRGDAERGRRRVHEYLRTLAQAVQPAGSPAPANPNPKSNFTGNVLGYFSAHTVQQRSIMVP